MKILNAGPDWYTGTNILTYDQTGRTLYHVFQSISQKEMRWRAGGYKGRECLETGIKYGSRVRKDGRADEILIGSGRSSEVVIDHLGDPDRFRATRLDLQITFQLENKDKLMASDLYNSTAMRRKFGTSPIGNRKMSLIRSETGDTLYLGSRSSAKKFFRLYDKSFEMKGYPGEFWRAEVQYGRDLASGALRWYLDIGHSKSALVDLICSEFFDAIEWSPVPQYQYNPQDFPPEDKEATTLANKMDWLKTCVRPTVTILQDEGLEKEAKIALGFSPAWDRRQAASELLKNEE
ncbi:MAG: replication initiation factor domain-containing protein [Planctomycetes bacterium]|nr:replication initiation factor domain-containing protein [Planctomycetota bacterium]